ncbi:MAG: hypothetical protein HLUCCA08_01285 [Rhodobacteraceae bacterium HLUCCA08]|nr:MAG: hypothetical protein HLUCCA08_01285 [Rhodobacteraceae bacterium HLUCCA08]
MTRTLLLILAALAFMVGSFIWFVATWDRAAEAPVTRHDAPQPAPLPWVRHIPGSGAEPRSDASRGHAA